MYCRTPKVRREIVEKYNVSPIGIYRVLGDSPMRSCAERDIAKLYYQFHYVHKEIKNDEGFFICGNGAGSHFKELIGISKMPIFNPLKDVGEETNSTDGDRIISSNSMELNPVARELRNAINIILLSWNKKPSDIMIMQKILIKTTKKPKQEPTKYNIKAINTIVSRDYKRRSLPEIVSDLKIKYPNFKDYSFIKLNKILNQEYPNEKSNYK